MNHIQSTLSRFHGVGRRFEVLGTHEGKVVISDYAHHPTALSAVISAALLRYPGKRILTVFRPHHKERTTKLFDAFVGSLLLAREMILVEIYDVPGREEGIAVSSRDLIQEVHKFDPRKDITYAKDLADAEEQIRSRAHECDVIMVIGAGDADILARRLVSP